MQAVFDIVDLLQLQEIWVWRPITQAYSRLERRQTALDCPVEFDLKALMPRLGQLRNSPAWQTNMLEKKPDPAQVPMCALTDAYLEVIFPGLVPAQARQQLFLSVYNHFVVSRFRDEVDAISTLLQLLAQTRSVEPFRCLDERDQPLSGSSYWIPVDLTDEIRNLDDRYNGAEPDMPATYVVADDFWLLLVKATPEEISEAAAHFCDDADCVERCKQRLEQLAMLARDWNRTSSVVGLYYQVESH